MRRYGANLMYCAAAKFPVELQEVSSEAPLLTTLNERFCGCLVLKAKSSGKWEVGADCNELAYQAADSSHWMQYECAC